MEEQIILPLFRQTNAFTAVGKASLGKWKSQIPRRKIEEELLRREADDDLPVLEERPLRVALLECTFEEIWLSSNHLLRRGSALFRELANYGV